jgi:hypothetical protein
VGGWMGSTPHQTMDGGTVPRIKLESSVGHVTCQNFVPLLGRVSLAQVRGLANLNDPTTTLHVSAYYNKNA